MFRTLPRWFPAITYVPRRDAALGIASLAFVGVAIAGQAGPSGQVAQTTAVTPPAVVAPAAPAAAPAAAAPAPATAPAAPAATTPSELALVPDYIAQPNYYYCGPAATRLAITAHGAAAPSLDDLAWMLGTTTDGTDSAADTTRVLNRVLGAGVYQTREIPQDAATAAEMDQLKADAVDAVSHGYAIVANVAGSVGDLGGGWHSYEGGHYLTVIGYGQGGLTLKISDPADPRGDGSYWVSTVTMANWMATRGYSA